MNSKFKPRHAIWAHLLLLFTMGVGWEYARGIETMDNGSGTFDTSAPTSSQIPNWNSGWGAADVTGWNYEGTVGGASGVYLGNGWVLTAAHVGAGTFTLGGISYSMVPGSAENLSNSWGTADLSLFQISQGPNLPPLTIETNTPSAYSSPVVMIGYGGGNGETWGFNTVTQTNLPEYVQSYTSTDYETQYGSFRLAGGSTIANDSMLVGGDSGGGDFVYDSSTGGWELAGINEGVNGNDSYMVQLSSYSTQFYQVSPVPEPTANCMALLGCGLLPILGRRARSKRHRPGL